MLFIMYKCNYYYMTGANAKPASNPTKKKSDEVGIGEKKIRELAEEVMRKNKPVFNRLAEI